jgi:hypothetical protein
VAAKQQREEVATVSLERRLDELERWHPDQPPTVIFYVMGDAPPLSEEDEERLIREAIERRPGAPLYCITWPPQERGEAAS